MSDAKEIRPWLAAMSYSEDKPGVWAKPIGWMLFLFIEKDNEWFSVFKTLEGKNMCYESKTYSEENGDFLVWLKNAECYTRTDIDLYSQFESGQKALIEKVVG